MTPATVPNTKYKVPMSRWLVLQTHRVNQFKIFVVKVFLSWVFVISNNPRGPTFNALRCKNPQPGRRGQTRTVNFSSIKRTLYHWVTRPVGVEGIEPSHNGSKDHRLTAWLYPSFFLLILVSALGLEPRTTGLKGRYSTIELCARITSTALWGDRTLIDTVKRCCPTIRRRELQAYFYFGGVSRIWTDADFSTDLQSVAFHHSAIAPLFFIYGQLLGIEPRSIEPQSTILPLDYSCRVYPLPDLNRHSEETAFKAAASTISPSGRSMCI